MSTRHQHALPFAKPEMPLRRPPPESLRELEIRAAALGGHTVAEVARALGVRLPDEPRRAKGFIGQLAERALGADPTAGEKPDFVEHGVELKTIPVRPDGSVQESTFCCSVAMANADRECWEDSRLRRRLGCVLWLPVEAAPKPLGERRFGRARLWRPSESEWEILRADWEELMGAIGCGRLPNSQQGRALQIRPKAQDSAVRTLAPAEHGVATTLPLGFYLRPSFTQVLLAGA